ncbi:MAG TPA: hypothetical protein VGE26_05475 [Sphingobacteriaceae bacterium]
MKKIRKNFGIGVTSLLLLIFSVTILPLDFFHSHASAPVCLSLDTESSCQHQLHVTSKGNNFCWVCSVHYDKAFTDNTQEEITWMPPVPEIATNNEFGVFVIELIFSPLRGPPSR